MKAVFRVTLTLLVLMCSIRGAFAEALLIAEGPIAFDDRRTQEEITFEVTEEQFSGSKAITLFVGAKSCSADSFAISCELNGQEIGGTTAGASWFIVGLGIGKSQIRAGMNKLLLIGRGSAGTAAGIALYFAESDGDDPGLLDLIPAKLKTASSTPSPEVSSPESQKEFCWVYGLVHVHSNRSDGIPTIKARRKEAKKLGLDFLIVADHGPQLGIGSKSSKKLDQYVEDCRAETVLGQFVMIPGAEISNPWCPDSKTKCFAHTLCLGPVQKTAALDKSSEKENGQAETIAAIKAMECYAVAAHPNLSTVGSVSSKPWIGRHYRYDRRTPAKYSGLCGIEIGNTMNPAQDSQDMEWFMELMKRHYPAMPTGGCDSHGSLIDKEDGERMKRLTGVFIEELTEDGILKGMRDGCIFASIEGVRIKDCEPIPSSIPQPVDMAHFSFTFSNLPQRVQCVLYRDGEMLPSSRKAVSPESPTYEWCDEDGPEGERWYNLRILPDFLITAPIVLNIAK